MKTSKRQACDLTADKRLTPTTTPQTSISNLSPSVKGLKVSLSWKARAISSLQSQVTSLQETKSLLKEVRQIQLYVDDLECSRADLVESCYAAKPTSTQLVRQHTRCGSWYIGPSTIKSPLIG